MRRAFTLILLAACIGCSDSGTPTPTPSVEGFQRILLEDSFFTPRSDLFIVTYEGKRHVFLRVAGSGGANMSKIGDYPIELEKAP